MAPNKTTLGILFILAGLAYGSLGFDKVYDSTLGFLVQHQWIQPPVVGKTPAQIFGRKSTIWMYSLIFIAIGIFILWNREI